MSSLWESYIKDTLHEVRRESGGAGGRLGVTTLRDVYTVDSVCQVVLQEELHSVLLGVPPLRDIYIPDVGSKVDVLLGLARVRVGEASLWDIYRVHRFSESSRTLQFYGGLLCSSLVTWVSYTSY